MTIIIERVSHVIALFLVNVSFHTKYVNKTNITTDTVNQCKRCPQNCMTEDPTHTWPTTMIPYDIDSRLSKKTCLTIFHMSVQTVFCTSNTSESVLFYKCMECVDGICMQAINVCKK